MKFFKVSWKIFKFCFIFMLIGILGCFLYIKFSPKITINSANNIALYDQDKKIFFRGSESKKWVELKDVSKYLIDSTI